MVRDITATSIAAVPPSFTAAGSGAIVVVVDGQDVDSHLRLGASPVVVGTHPDADLVLSDPTVSRRHLRLLWSGRRLQVTDLESKNGSFYQGSRFQSIELAPGAVFHAGKTAIKIIPEETVLDPEAYDSGVFGRLIGQSAAMRQVFTLIKQVAASDASVLIEAETGCGKEVVAEEIHRRSPRQDKPFGIFDCGSVPDELIESTLFGHVRGAFTGAATDRQGIFAASHGGTVFLDEIGELKLELQPALLRVLDKRQVRPVGSTDYREADTRIVAATHRNFGNLIAGGQFREDLYYRLAVVRVTIPPLRSRLEDIPLLVEHFLAKLGRPDMQFDAKDYERAQSYEWPGNVRELRNAVERSVALGGGELLVPGNATRQALLAMHMPRATEPLESSSGDATRLTEKIFREAKADAIADFERRYLGQLIEENGTINAAAKAAQMDRKYLKGLLDKYGLNPNS